jgi:hypothetical protein
MEITITETLLSVLEKQNLALNDCNEIKEAWL